MSKDKGRVQEILRRKADADAEGMKDAWGAARKNQPTEERARQVSEAWPVKFAAFQAAADALNEELEPGRISLQVKAAKPNAPDIGSSEVTLIGLPSGSPPRVTINVHPSGRASTRVNLPKVSKPFKELDVLEITPKTARAFLLDFLDEAVPQRP